MVYLFGRGERALFLALRTQWVRLDILIAYPSPLASIPFFGGGIALVALIVLGHQLGVLITKAPFGQLGAGRIAAGAFGFSRHGQLLLQRTALEANCSKGSIVLFDRTIIAYI